jgi:nucleoside-diphosphate-sugar epimerase
VTRVVHCAASVSFDLGLEESRCINVEGTSRVVELAERLIGNRFSNAVWHLLMLRCTTPMSLSL